MSERTHSIIAYITWIPIIIEKLYVYTLWNKWDSTWHGSELFYMTILTWAWSIGTFYIVFWPAFGYYDFINILKRKFDSLFVSGVAWIMMFSFVVDLAAIFLIKK